MPKVEGVCPRKMRTVRRWFYDSNYGSCKHFLFSGCGGNANNFHSRHDCQEQCVLGACCYRQYKLQNPSISNEKDEYSHARDSLGHNMTETGTGNQPKSEQMWWSEHNPNNVRVFKKRALDYHTNISDDADNMNFTELNDGSKRGDFHKAVCANEEIGQQGALFKPYVCEYVSLMQCQRMARSGSTGQLEVVSFSPGLRYSDLNFAPTCGCWLNGRLYQPGEAFQLACEACVCTYRGVVECTCHHLSQRREVRDMSQSAREEYHRAVQNLYYKSGTYQCT